MMPEWFSLMRRAVRLRSLWFGALAGLVALGAQAQAWPTKTVRVIVPFPPGGASDTLARAMAQKLTDQTGQTFLIENKPGAASTIGIAEAAKTPADGYSILLAAAPFVITQYVYPKLSYDVQKDFVPLGLLQTTPLVLVAHPSQGMKTPAEFLRAAKASPGKISYATPGAGSLPHLVGELFKQQAGIDLLHVPYKGGGPAVADLLAGHVNSSFLSPIEIQAHVKAGKMVAVASTGPKRTSGLGDVPTLAESGVPNFEALAWFGFVARAGTPPDVLARMSEQFVKALNSPDLRGKIAQTGDVPAGTQVEFADLLKAEHLRWARTVKAANITPN
jgi:tripartite-type tricarboxylate transporter receptor subunit TctC